MTPEQRGQTPAGATSGWERVVAALGAVVVAAALGVMVHAAIVTRRDPIPRIVVEVDTVVAHGAGFVTRLRVRNDGGATAAQVLVHGELHGNDGVVERSETTVDYVPGRSTRRTGLLFTNDPRRHRLEVRAVGYQEP